MATSGKGLPFIGKMNEFLDRILHPTVNKVGHSKAALDVTSRAFYAVNDILTPSIAEGGSTDNLLISTGLNAVAGDIIRFVSTANGILEREITVHEVLGPNEVILAGYLSDVITAGDTFHLLRPTVSLVSANGSSLSTVISPPIQIIKNGTIQTVEDSATPGDVVAVPVVIKAVDGTNITIQAGDISVQNSAEGVNFDSMRIGDGTLKYAGITDNLELKVKDEDTYQQLTSIDGGIVALADDLDEINTKTPALGQALAAGSVPVVLPAAQIAALTPPAAITGYATETTLDLIRQRAALLATESRQITAQTRLDLLATEARQITAQTRLDLLATEASLLNSITQETAINTVLGLQATTAATTDTGSFPLMGFVKRGMQNWTLLLAKIPALGQALKAASIPVVLASDSDAINTTEKNSAGQIQKNTLAANAATTAIAPAGAVGCIIKNQSASDGTLYWEIGGTANNLSNDLVGGQGTAFIPCTATISLLAGSDGACNYAVQWLIK